MHAHKVFVIMLRILMEIAIRTSQFVSKVMQNRSIWM